MLVRMILFVFTLNCVLRDLSDIIYLYKFIPFTKWKLQFQTIHMLVKSAMRREISHAFENSTSRVFHRTHTYVGSVLVPSHTYSDREFLFDDLHDAN